MTAMNPQIMQAILQSAAQNRAQAGQNMLHGNAATLQSAQERAAAGVKAAMFIQQLKQAQAERAQQAQMQQQQLLAHGMQQMAEQRAREQMAEKERQFRTGEGEKERELKRSEGSAERAAAMERERIRAGNPDEMSPAESQGVAFALNEIQTMQQQLRTMEMDPNTKPEAIEHMKKQIAIAIDTYGKGFTNPAAKKHFDTVIGGIQLPGETENILGQVNWEDKRKQADAEQAKKKSEINRGMWKNLPGVLNAPENFPTPSTTTAMATGAQIPYYGNNYEQSPARGYGDRYTPGGSWLNPQQILPATPPPWTGGASRIPPTTQPTTTLEEQERIYNALRLMGIDPSGR